MGHCRGTRNTDQGGKIFHAEQYGFHDTELSGIAENACHAVAVDEYREEYCPTLWDPKQKPNQRLEQVWFVGAHADVGGGYRDQPLSDITLNWMAHKAMLNGNGLELDPSRLPSLPSNIHDLKVTDSFGQFAFGLYKLIKDPFLRTVGRTRYGNELLDPTVIEKLGADTSYKPKNPGLQEVAQRG
jgi:hypothetical protein